MSLHSVNCNSNVSGFKSRKRIMRKTLFENMAKSVQFMNSASVGTWVKYRSITYPSSIFLQPRSFPVTSHHSLSLIIFFLLSHLPYNFLSLSSLFVIQNLFGELARVLKPNGMLTIVTDNLWLVSLSVCGICVSVRLSVCPSVCLLACLFVCLFVCQSVSQSVSQSQINICIYTPTHTHTHRDK